MSEPTRGVDRLGTLGASAWALLGLAAFDVLAVPWLPATADAFLALAVPLLSVLLLAVGLGAERPRPTLLRALALLLASTPALVAAVVLASGGVVGTRLPGLGLGLAVALTLAFAALPLRVRRGAAGLVLAAWGADAVLATAQIPLLPAALNPLRAPRLEQPRRAAPPRPPTQGPRAGALVPGPGGDEAQAWYVLADEGPTPRGTPMLRLLGSPPPGLGERFVADVGAGAGGPAVPQEVVVLAGGSPPQRAYDLGGLELVGLASDAWPTAGAAPTWARAVLDYVRMGGQAIVLGSAEGPPGLAQELREAGAGPGPEGSRRLGAGALWYAADAAGLPSVAARALASRPRANALDGSAPPAAPPDVLRPRLERGRRPLGLLLLGVALAVGLLEGGARTLRGLLVALVLPLLAALAGVWLLVPSGRDVAVGAVWLEVGGPGGRRLDALWLQAGERGYRGALEAGPLGVLRHAPGGGVGAVELDPGVGAWLVIERPAPAAPPARREDRGAGWLREFLALEAEPARLGFARGPLPGLLLEGVALPDAVGVEVRPAE